MRVALSIALALVMLTGCGIRKPLMKPKDIPAYEEKRERKREQLERDLREAPTTRIEDAPEAAPPTPTTTGN